MFMPVFGIHCTFFIALPIRLKTCRFIFFFLQDKMCSPEKSGASQRFCVPERARSTLGAQFVQAGSGNVEMIGDKNFKKF